MKLGKQVLVAQKKTMNRLGDDVLAGQLVRLCGKAIGKSLGFSAAWHVLLH